MAAKKTKKPVAPKPAPKPGPSAAPKPAPIADFDDTIAHNRALPVFDAGNVPKPPAGYRPTDPDVRNRRLRKLSAGLRAEADLALAEAAERDLKDDLGKHAPDPADAAPLRARLEACARLHAAARAFHGYAREIDQIVMSDVLRYLELEHKELVHAMEHEPAIAEKYPKLRALFAARAGAIAEGLARKAASEPEDEVDAEAEEEPAVEGE